jgi:hypothetical protein
MKDAVLNYEQKLYIDGTQMRGVQSVNGSYSISEKPINILGYGHVDYGFNYFGEGLRQLDYSSIVQYLQTENIKDVETERLFELLTDGAGGPFETPGEDFDFRRNSPFVLTSENGFLVQPYKSLAVLDAPLQGSFSLESLLISEDFMFKYIGDNPFSGSIHHGDRYFGFNDGYINSHSVTCSVGSVPRTSTEITVFGDIGGSPDGLRSEDGGDTLPFITEDGKDKDQTNSAQGDNPFPEIRIPSHGSIIMKIGGAETDRVTQFSHAFNIELSPIYKVGDYNPVQVDVVWPMTSQTSFTIEVDQYEYKRLRGYLNQPTIHDIGVYINDCFGKKIQNYTVVQARLINEAITSSVDGVLTVNLTYKSYYNKRRW